MNYSFFIAARDGDRCNSFILNTAKQFHIKLANFRYENWGVDTEKEENRIQKRIYFKFDVDNKSKSFEKFKTEISKYKD